MSDEINSQPTGEPWIDGLKRLRANVPSDLQRRIFYQAGHEAARAELAHGQRRFMALAAACVLFSAVSSASVSWYVASSSPADRIAYMPVGKSSETAPSPTATVIRPAGPAPEVTDNAAEQFAANDLYDAIAQWTKLGTDAGRRQIHGMQIGPIGSDWDSLVSVQRPAARHQQDASTYQKRDDNWELPELRGNGSLLKRRVWDNTRWPKSL